MEFAVSRPGTALVTLHGGSDTTAREDARDTFAATLDELETDAAIADWDVTDVAVYEQPTAPFEPYTIAVSFTIIVTVDAADAAAATDAATPKLDAILERTELDDVTYEDAPTATAMTD